MMQQMWQPLEDGVEAIKLANIDATKMGSEEFQAKMQAQAETVGSVQALCVVGLGPHRPPPHRTQRATWPRVELVLTGGGDEFIKCSQPPVTRYMTFSRIMHDFDVCTENTPQCSVRWSTEH